jgi:hypothetical protein
MTLLRNRLSSFLFRLIFSTIFVHFSGWPLFLVSMRFAIFLFTLSACLRFFLSSLLCAFCPYFAHFWAFLFRARNRNCSLFKLPLYLIFPSLHFAFFYFYFQNFSFYSSLFFTDHLFYSFTGGRGVHESVRGLFRRGSCVSGGAYRWQHSSTVMRDISGSAISHICICSLSASNLIFYFLSISILYTNTLLYTPHYFTSPHPSCSSLWTQGSTSQCGHSSRWANRASQAAATTGSYPCMKC